MNKRQIKLNFRDAVNKMTGKQVLIDEYNALTAQLCEMSDNTPSGTQLKKDIIKSIESITEEMVKADGNNGFYIASYNPYQGSKATTQKKINELKSVLFALEKAQNAR